MDCPGYPRDLEEILQMPDLDPIVGAMYFHLERVMIEAALQSGRCPWCRMALTGFEVRTPWLHVLPCGCRVGHAGSRIDPAIIAAWDEAYPDS